jgi:hypothetical protein
VGAVPGSCFFKEDVRHLIRFHFAKRDERIEKEKEIKSDFVPSRGTFIPGRGTFVPSRGTFVPGRGTFPGNNDFQNLFATVMASHAIPAANFVYPPQL